MVGIFQPWHLIVVLVIVMMVFGPGKLPELGKAIGDGLRELKKSTSGEDDKPAA
jgi:sec-independent protein translocase protein TatA